MSVLDNLSQEQEEAYLELRKRIEDDVPLEIREKWTYIRFLIARNFNLDAAEKMLRNHITWRKIFQMDTQSFKDYSPSKMIQKHITLSRIGLDFDGCPISYVDFGNIDVSGIVCSYARKDIMKTLVKYFEEDILTMKQRSKNLGKPIERWSFILNFENATFAKVTHKEGIELLMAVLSLYEANYPETLKEALVINASIYFKMLFAVVKPLLAGSTVKKLTIYAKDGWKEHLSRMAAADVMPAFLGGKRTDEDGDEMCHSFINHGQLIPKKYYLKNTSTRLKNNPGSCKLTVSRMAKKPLKAIVSEKDSFLEWAFDTSDRDIGFTVLYKKFHEEDSKSVEIVPKQRIDSHIISETGIFKCKEPGQYTLVFDNTYSWFYQKEIYYKIQVVTPSGQQIPVQY